MYRSSFNQNFLVNPALVSDLLEQSTIGPTDIVYDIGAGKGIISQALVKKAKRVIALEPDAKYFDFLVDKFTNIQNIEILRQDFLKLKLIDEPFKVFSNIPFNITTEIFTKLCFNAPTFTQGYFVVDENALNKSMLFICIHNLFDTQPVFSFLRSDFNPAPTIKTVLLELIRKPTPEIDNISLFNDFIAAIFMTNQPTVLKSFKKIFSDKQALRLCHDHKLSNLSKLSQINQQTWYKLYNFYEKNQSIVPRKVAGSFNLQYNTQSQLKKYHDTYSL